MPATQENLKNMIVDSLKYMKDSADKFSEEMKLETSWRPYIITKKFYKRNG